MVKHKLETIYKHFHKFLIEAKLEDEVESKFKQIGPSRMISECYSLMSVGQVFPQLEPRQLKSDRTAEKLRLEGNRFFVEKSNFEALSRYTQAVANATANGKELPLAYANRSAVTFVLGEYRDSIKDIDRALNLNYPEKLTFKILERKAKCFKALEFYSEAASLDFLPKTSFDKNKCSCLQSYIETQIKELSQETDSYIEPDPPYIPKLSHEKSPYIQSASSVVDIEHSTSMGRHIVANADIKPGDVLVVEKPFCCELVSECYNFFCYMCTKRCHSMIPCHQCCLVLFCSEACKSACWENNHRIGCDALPYFLSLDGDKSMILAFKIVMMVTKQGGNIDSFLQLMPYLELVENDDPKRKGFLNGVYYSDSVKAAHNLETNVCSRNIPDLLPRIVLATCALKVLKDKTRFFDFVIKPTWQDAELFPNANFNLSVQESQIGAIILMYLLIVPSNGHEISEMQIKKNGSKLISESYELGAALYPFLSLINHSCDPNVVRHSYNGNICVLRAIQAIKKGEQLFDSYSYLYPMHNIDERQQRLCLQYFFVCKCPPCLNNWPLYKQLPVKPVYFEGADVKKVVKSSEKFKEVLSQIIEGDSKGKLPFLYSHLDLIQSSVEKPWIEFNNCQEAVKECLGLEANHYYFYYE